MTSGEEEAEVNPVMANSSITTRGVAPAISKMLTSMETSAISIKDSTKEAMDVDMVMVGIKVTASRITIETRVVVVVSTLVGDGTSPSNAPRLQVMGRRKVITTLLLWFQIKVQVHRLSPRPVW
jgi:hypothetical protein